MTKEQQIEEMAKTYEEARLKANETLGSMNEGADRWYANAFYNAGYRKASSVAEEVIDILEDRGLLNVEPWGISDLKSELKKKYTEEGK